MNWFKRLIGKDQPPPPPPTVLEWPKINEDWAPGDQALCLFLLGDPGHLVLGEVYIVTDVIKGFHASNYRPGWGLVLRGVPPPDPPCTAWAAIYFRKITPKADTEECEEEFRRLITKKAPEKAL